MFRADRLLRTAGALALCGLLVACGSPPEPPASAPPLISEAGPSASASLPPPVPTPATPATVATVPPTTLPAYPAYPTLTTPTITAPATTYSPPVSTTTPTRTPTTPAVAGAPRCPATGPKAAQLVDVVAGTKGIPDRPLEVVDGPYCAGAWQFSVMEIEAADADDKYEPLSVVTKGQPATLQLVEAGTDVCSVLVQGEAPAGIRVRACGA